MIPIPSARDSRWWVLRLSRNLGILGEDKSLAAQTLKESGVRLSFVREQVARLARTSK
jgi:hypothetical protein